MGAYAINPYLRSMSLSPEMLQDALQKLQIKELNAMQEEVLTQCETHTQLMLLAATGSGKTLGFLLPVWQHHVPEQRGTQAMIVAPSRELALQIGEVFSKMSTGLKLTLCYGGHKREIEENNLLEAPFLIIGTPGRICDHLRRGNIDPTGIHTLVLDEFDKSLEEGFLDEMQFITHSLKAVKYRILTSATEAVDLPDFLGMQEVHRMDYLDRTGRTEEQLSHYKVQSSEKDKLPALVQLLCEVGSRPTIVFCNHRDAVERVHEYLRAQGIYSVFYHGGMEQFERDAALCKFRNGTSLILVTTDLAARGLDIAHVRHIIHYHLPLSEEIYTHRNGRTARMDKSGNTYVLYGPEEELPAYIEETCTSLLPRDNQPLPDKPDWATLFVAAGKKDKINKIDILGFLTQKGDLRMEDVGLIEVKDFSSFVAIRRGRMNHLLGLIKDQKIKGKRVKMAVAK